MIVKFNFELELYKFLFNTWQSCSNFSALLLAEKSSPGRKKYRNFLSV